MRVNDPGAKDKRNESRPSSTGKVYEQLVEDLFMGSTSEDVEESEESADSGITEE